MIQSYIPFLNNVFQARFLFAVLPVKLICVCLFQKMTNCEEKRKEESFYKESRLTYVSVICIKKIILTNFARKNLTKGLLLD